MGFLTVKLNKVFDHGVPNHFFYILKHQLLFILYPRRCGAFYAVQLAQQAQLSRLLNTQLRWSIWSFGNLDLKSGATSFTPRPNSWTEWGQ
jgi:hypothetical protein